MSSSPSDLQRDFAAASVGGASKPSKKTPSKTTSISVRVTEEEKAALQAMAGSMAIAHYIRSRLFGNDTEKRPKHYHVKPSQPSTDAKEIAQLLGMFGQSELATSMLALSLAATQGHIDVTPDIEEKIECACDDIHTIKLALILALGVKPQGKRSG